MLFNSFDFLIFFPIVTLIYFSLAFKFRWVWLLVASCYFYMAFVPIYILILGFTIVIDYFAGIWIENAPNKTKKKILLSLSLIANIGVLAIFKYYNFFNENITTLLSLAGKSNPIPYLNILLPIGLSFHTFQAMSYTIEVYRGNQKAEKHFGIYSLYVMFYPQLVAGPIERPQNILHQFHTKHNFNYSLAASGLKLMTWGLFKKVVVADNVSILANTIYSSPNEQNGLTALIGAYAFSFQIYCDFSGYSDIAIGCARVMGFNLMNNFNIPYLAHNISNFWSRWHISLSTWFRDYLYIPLGGNKVSKWRWYINLLIVFLISGLWHGAAWTFIIWGFLNWLFTVAEKIYPINKLFSKKNFLSIFLTFHLTTLAWIFFRAPNFEDAFIIISKIFELPIAISQLFASQPVFAPLKLESSLLLPLLLLLTVAFYTIDWLKNNETLNKKFDRNMALRYTIYFLLITSIFLFGYMEEDTSFIYFQF
ncbi:MAG: MBOAT family protein [Bacteroidetes bacterium]|nr:MBOAT family protein [Bacteroidota bacterium]